MTADIGLIFAIISAICFAAGTVVIRRGLYHTETAMGVVFISVPLGMIYFAVLLIVTGQYVALLHVPWHIIVLFGIIGVINFIGGRLLNYTGIQILGANRNATIMRTNPLWAVILGLTLLNESLTILNITGIVLVVSGATMVSAKKENQTRTLHVKGVAASLGGALLYAVAAVLIRAIVKEVGSPIAAAFIAFTIASIVLAGLLSHGYFKRQLFQLERRSIVPFVIGAILSATAQFFRFNALDYTPVSLVEPVMSNSAVFVLIFSFFINRKIEIFNVRVIMGIISSGVGAALLFM